MKSPRRREKTGADSLIKAGQPFRWKPGQSGNPSGRPATQKLSAAIRHVLGQCVPGTDGVTYAQLIAQTLAEKAVGGDVRAAEIHTDRSAGKAARSIDLEVTQSAQRFESMTREELLRYGDRPATRGNEPCARPNHWVKHSAFQTPLPSRLVRWSRGQQPGCALRPKTRKSSFSWLRVRPKSAVSPRS